VLQADAGLDVARRELLRQCADGKLLGHGGCTRFCV